MLKRSSLFGLWVALVGVGVFGTFIISPTHAVTLYNNFPVESASYLGASGADTIRAVEVNAIGVYLGGKAVNYPVPNGVNEVTLLGGGEGIVLLSEYDGTPMLIARLPNEVLDLESNGAGQFVLCGAFGVALTDTYLGSVTWVKDTLGTVDRCAITDDGTIAALVANSDTIYTYNISGDSLGTWTSGSSSRQFADLALHAPSQTVIEVGYNQAASNLQVAFMKGRSYDGTIKWTAYDFSASAVNGQNLAADSRGERVTIGQDGKLYFSGYVDGGNAIYKRNPQNITVALGSDQLIATDPYNTPFNISGAKALAWYGRFNPSNGVLERGQFLLTRLSDGKGNSISIKALDANSDGVILAVGEAYASIESRNTRQVNGITVGGYAGGEPFALMVTPDMTQRLQWTPFAAPTKSAGNSPVYGAAIYQNHAALGATITLTSGQRVITTANAQQPSVGGGNSDGYGVFWTLDFTEPSLITLTAPQNGTIVNTTAPTFAWTVTDADEFKLWVKDNAGVKRLNLKQPTDAFCNDAGECEITPNNGFALKNGVYTWRVIASNPLARVKSDKFTFTVEFPGTPILISPAPDAEVGITPTFTWESVAAATEYRVFVKQNSTGIKTKSAWLNAQTICAPSCTYTVPNSLALGGYTWWVSAQQTPITNRSKSEKRGFTVVANPDLLPIPESQLGTR